MHYKLIISIFGCATIPRYKNEIMKIKETWAQSSNTSIKILFFLGEEKVVDLEDESENCIFLPNVMNDYLSASYKQNLGLKYIYDNYTCDYVLCCGTDTYINIPKLDQLLTNYTSTDDLYIGGHGDYRTIHNTPYYYHSGGPGFLLSFSCFKKIYPYLASLTDIWICICKENNKMELITACDVAISYFLQNLVKPEIVKLNTMFFNCNHKGWPCHLHKVNMSEIVACHNMSLDDFDHFHDILKKNDFFMNNLMD